MRTCFLWVGLTPWERATCSLNFRISSLQNKTTKKRILILLVCAVADDTEDDDSNRHDDAHDCTDDQEDARTEVLRVAPDDVLGDLIVNTGSGSVARGSWRATKSSNRIHIRCRIVIIALTLRGLDGDGKDRWGWSSRIATGDSVGLGVLEMDHHTMNSTGHDIQRQTLWQFYSPSQHTRK